MFWKINKYFQVSHHPLSSLDQLKFSQTGSKLAEEAEKNFNKILEENKWIRCVKKEKNWLRLCCNFNEQKPYFFKTKQVLQIKFKSSRKKIFMRYAYFLLKTGGYFLVIKYIIFLLNFFFFSSLHRCPNQK